MIMKIACAYTLHNANLTLHIGVFLCSVFSLSFFFSFLFFFLGHATTIDL